MKDHESKEKRELSFYRVFCRHILPSITVVMLLSMYFAMKIPLEYVLKFSIGIVVAVTVAYFGTKCMLKTPGVSEWRHYWWQSKKRR